MLADPSFHPIRAISTFLAVHRGCLLPRHALYEVCYRNDAELHSWLATVGVQIVPPSLLCKFNCHRLEVDVGVVLL
jgi:hypothetical protein